MTTIEEYEDRINELESNLENREHEMGGLNRQIADLESQLDIERRQHEQSEETFRLLVIKYTRLEANYRQACQTLKMLETKR